MSRTLHVLAVVVLLPLGLTACGEDVVASEAVESPAVSTGAPSPDATTAPTTDPTTEPATSCVSVVPDAALGALGWAPVDPAALDAGRCVRRVDGVGAVTVGTRSHSGGDPATVPRQQCEELLARGGYVAQPVNFLDPAREQSCLSALGDGTGTGVAELYVVDDADEVIQIRVEALRRVEVDSLRSGPRELAGASADLSDAV